MLRKIGSIYHIDLPSKAGRVRETTGTADKRLAQEKHDRRKVEIWREDHLGERRVTWLEAVAAWMEHKQRSLPERYMVKALGIEPEELLPLPTKLLTEKLTGRSFSSWNRLLNVMGAVHRASGFTPPAVPRKPTPPPRTRWLREREWKRLEKALRKESPLLAQAAAFTLATGLRENNVLELEWGQVDLKRRTIALQPSAMKNKEALGVRLNDDAVAVLEARRGIDRRWVFGNPDYPLTKASNKAWYAALRKAKLVGFRWHDLRHTWASWAVMSGVSLMQLKEMGGWKTLAMVGRYAHLATEHLAEAAAKVKPIK